MINNGSTLMNDVDLRHYFYIERNQSLQGGGDISQDGSSSSQPPAEVKKSELYLSVTSVEDNGTFSCIAENRAGSARANFTLHVVIPMPPKPPQVRRNSQFFSNFVVMKSSKSIYIFKKSSIFRPLSAYCS